MAKLDAMSPSFLHLYSAFLAMEPPEVLISLARVCGGGSITEEVQSFFRQHCLNNDDKSHSPYMRSFLKKLIVEAESKGADILDELYEQYAYYMTSLKDNDSNKGNFRVLKRISFLFPDSYVGSEVLVHSKSSKLVVDLLCSLNMLEGDTGCAIWPSSLFLSELILSHPTLFSSKSCFEVGSGVGLVGMCLAEVKASKVILSDGDLSSLANLKVNLKLNQLHVETDSERFAPDSNVVHCIHLPWESAQESELQHFSPDVVLGADVIYDPLCLPHLIRVLSVLLKPKRPYFHLNNGVLGNPFLGKNCGNSEIRGASDSNAQNLERKRPHHTRVVEKCHTNENDSTQSNFQNWTSPEGPVAYIASVIRNIETFNYFLKLAGQANIVVTDLTEVMKPLDLLPYIQTYQRSAIRLFSVSYPST